MRCVSRAVVKTFSFARVGLERDAASYARTTTGECYDVCVIYKTKQNETRCVGCVTRRGDALEVFNHVRVFEFVAELAIVVPRADAGNDGELRRRVFFARDAFGFAHE